MNYQKEKTFWQFLLEVTVFREDEPRPILGAAVALGGPFFVTGLSRIFVPELNDRWPVNMITNFTIKVIPILGGALIMLGTFFLIHKGNKIMFRKIKNIFKETKKEFAKELISHHEHFERQLAKYIKEDKRTRDEEMIKFKNEILKLLDEKLGLTPANAISPATESVIKNFI